MNEVLMNKKSAALKIAVNTYLSSYNGTPEDVMSILAEAAPDATWSDIGGIDCGKPIVVWEAVERYSPAELYDFITILSDEIYYTFK